jgi:murein DD-endopeptidase MepM/ murein hydrolase activator NlpD
LLTGPKFVRVPYVMFAVAVVLALLKLGGIIGTKPLFLKMVPATPTAKAAEPAPAKNTVPDGEVLDLADANGRQPEPVRRSLTKTKKAANLPSREDHARTKESPRDDTPVFYRPSSGQAQGSGESVCGNLGDFPKSSRVVFPLPRSYFDSYEDTWGAARPQGSHEGTDLMSPTATPEVAITDGTIVPVKGANENGWNTLGGYTVMLESAYDAGPIKKGDLFYYAHMDRKSVLPLGTKVRAGQQIGVVGDTGEGREAVRGKFPSHLHLGWYDTGSSSSRTNLKSGAMNPYPLLLWLEQNGGAVTGGTDAAYCEASQGPVPDSSGTSPDLDTGDDNDARPSPIVGESRNDHGRSSEHEPGQENRPKKETVPTEADRAITTRGSSKAGPADGSGNGVTGDGTNEPRTPQQNGPVLGLDQVSRPSSGDKSLQAKIQSFLVNSSRPHLTSRPSHVSMLMDILRKPEKKDERDGRDDRKPVNKKHKKQKKPPEPPKREEPEKDMPPTKTGSSPARSKPVPDKKDTVKSPASKKNLEASSETTGAGERKPTTSSRVTQ